jgi:hypothetical protein
MYPPFANILIFSLMIYKDIFTKLVSTKPGRILLVNTTKILNYRMQIILRARFRCLGRQTP